MGGSVSMINGHIDPIEKADCSKCITECKSKEHFEHEMWVQEHGCNRFQSRGDTE